MSLERKIEKNIPLPQKKQSRISQYNFVDAMEVGDSVVTNNSMERNGITQRMRKHGWQPTYRKVRDRSENFPSLWRVWRVA